MKPGHITPSGGRGRGCGDSLHRATTESQPGSMTREPEARATAAVNAGEGVGGRVRPRRKRDWARGEQSQSLVGRSSRAPEAEKDGTAVADKQRAPERKEVADSPAVHYAVIAAPTTAAANKRRRDHCKQTPRPSGHSAHSPTGQAPRDHFRPVSRRRRAPPPHTPANAPAMFIVCCPYPAPRKHNLRIDNRC
uniref:Uncharacterized protein n=1 Tax=Plectus sambesii TaxID=2011161 RepID=A0A914X013_9BILA